MRPTNTTGKGAQDSEAPGLPSPTTTGVTACFALPRSLRFASLPKRSVTQAHSLTWTWCAYLQTSCKRKIYPRRSCARLFFGYDSRHQPAPTQRCVRRPGAPPSVQLHLRLGAAGEAAGESVERGLGCSVERAPVHLVERAAPLRRGTALPSASAQLPTARTEP